MRNAAGDQRDTAQSPTTTDGREGTAAPRRDRRGGRRRGRRRRPGSALRHRARAKAGPTGQSADGASGLGHPYYASAAERLVDISPGSRRHRPAVMRTKYRAGRADPHSPPRACSSWPSNPGFVGVKDARAIWAAGSLVMMPTDMVFYAGTTSNLPWLSVRGGRFVSVVGTWAGDRLKTR